MGMSYLVTPAQVRAAQLQVQWMRDRGETPPVKLVKLANAQRLTQETEAPGGEQPDENRMHAAINSGDVVEQFVQRLGGPANIDRVAVVGSSDLLVRLNVADRSTEDGFPSSAVRSMEPLGDGVYRIALIVDRDGLLADLAERFKIHATEVNSADDSSQSMHSWIHPQLDIDPSTYQRRPLPPKGSVRTVTSPVLVANGNIYPVINGKVTTDDGEFTLNRVKPASRTE